MKISKVLVMVWISVISFNILILPTTGVGFELEGKIKPIPGLIEDPAIENLIEDINLLKQKIGESLEECWRKPKSIRKLIIIAKLGVVQRKIKNGDYEEAYDKMLYDIKPKITGLKTDENEEPLGNGLFKKPWVICDDLKEEFQLDCNNILSQIRSLFEPVQDITPPEIIITPMDLTISDGDAIGGVMVHWVITDESGIGTASVSLNGETIASYGVVDSISDSIMLPNTLGDKLLQITASDTNGLESSAQSTISIFDDDTTAPTISITYVGSGTDFDSGWWYITIEDIESGIDEVQILINGFEFLHDQNINGQPSITYPQVITPGSVGTHILEVIVKDNDKDRDWDQQSSWLADTVDIIHDPNPPPLIILFSE